MKVDGASHANAKPWNLFDPGTGQVNKRDIDDDPLSAPLTGGQISRLLSVALSTMSPDQ